MIVGSEITLDADGEAPLKLVLLVETREGYTTLCRLITQGRRRSAKGEYRLTRDDLADGLPGLLVLWIPDARMSFEDGAWLKPRFDGRLWLAVELHRGADDARRLHGLLSLAEALGIPAVASGDVHMHVRGRRALQDTMTAIRHRTTIAQAGKRLFPNGERHLRTRRALSAIHPRHLLDETLRIADRCRFSLDSRWATSIRTNSYRTAIRRRRGCASWSRTACAQRWPEGESPRRARAHRKRTEADPRRSSTNRTSSPSTTSSASPGRRTSCARGADRRRIRWSATRSASPRSTRRAWACCSSASCPRSATSRRTSTSTSSTSGARKSSSTSTSVMAATAPRSPRP